ncbi:MULTISPECIES: prepilin peptidase [Thermomonosporaceae]|uniref:prepilin peptidase n=1 Tax=Thermomonosporaceae TaxID=2012 RepID=UPI00255B1E5E|nr:MULTISPECIES: A24 family peptidase [Thermomonosporaceae]MDL4772201.1 A24 family peptidase [Actinomadura xylanilytica]
MNAHLWTAVVTLPAGLLLGLRLAPMTAPYAGEPSRRRGFAMAAVLAAACGVLGWRFGPAPVLVALLYLAAVGTLLAFVDAAVKRLPDRFTLPSYGIGAALLALAVPFTDDGLRRFGYALAGMAALWLIYLVQHWLVPRGMGAGDVKLSGVLGLYLGWFGSSTWVAGMLLGFVLGGVAGTARLIVRRERSTIPFGPYMLAGALLALLFATP